MTPYWFRFAFAFLGIFALSSCEDWGEGPPFGDGWAVFRLGDPGLTSYQVRDVPLAGLDLALVPFITVRDIRSYDWDTHEIEFTPEMDAILDTMALRGGSTQGVPFVVTVGKDRIYVGTFWWGYSSSMPWCPYIETISLKPRSIKLPSLHQGPDPRTDWRIYSSLKRAGVLAED